MQVTYVKRNWKELCFWLINYLAVVPKSAFFKDSLCHNNMCMFECVINVCAGVSELKVCAGVSELQVCAGVPELKVCAGMSELKVTC